MNLNDRLQEFNNDELVYIGSRSAFFFIGTSKEFYEQEYRLNRKWKQKYVDSLRNAETKLTMHIEKKPEEGKDLIQTYKDLFTHKTTTIVTPYDKLLKDWEKRKAELERQKEKASKSIDKFKSFRDRKVIESYHRIDPNDGTVIIIKGNEVGGYWVLSDTKKAEISEVFF